MPTFGQHETERRLFLSGVGGLYALRGDAKKAVKILRPQAGVWSEYYLREEIDGFLLRGKTQKRLAKESKYWAPVHEVGGIPTSAEETSATEKVDTGLPDMSGKYRACGAYAVVDRYERTVHTLIEGRVYLTNDDLRHIMTGVISGLIDIRKIAKRPHGSLKSTNILLANSTDLAAATVHLSDPAADGSLTPASGNKDLADLAKILYELVNLRPYQGGTIGRTKEWDALGPNGEDWRKLCNALLDAHLPAGGEERDLEKILPVIRTWTAKPKKSKTPMLIAASVLFVLIVGGGAAWFFTRPPKLDFNQQTWEKLCLSYYGWFGDFSDRMADDAARKKFSSDPYPADVVKLFADAAKDLDKYSPRKIAKRPSAANELAVDPTDDAKTGYGPYYTEKGVELVDAVSSALSPEHWQLLQRLNTTAKNYEDRGWQKPAAGIRALIAAARPPALPTKPAAVAERAKLVTPTDVFSSIDKTIVAAKTVTDIDGRWARIQDQLKKLPGGDAQNVPLLKALPTFAEEFPRSQAEPDKEGTLEDVTSLAASFTQIEKLVNQLVADLSKPGQEIVYAELAKDPAVQLPENAPLTLDGFATLPTVARGYVKLASDPRAGIDWNKSLDDIQKQFIDVIKEANAQDPNLPALNDQLARVHAAKDAFAATSPIAKNKEAIDQQFASASGLLATLKTNGETWVAPYIIDPATYISQQRAKLTDAKFPLAKATPVVYNEWKNAQNKLLAKVAAAPAELKKYLTYKAVDAKFNALEKIYTDFDAKIPPPAHIPGLAEVAGNGWAHAIADHVATAYRENALKDIMTDASLAWADDQPQVEEQRYVSYQRQRLADFEKSRTDALALIGDYTTLSDRLDRLQLQANEPAAGATSWRDLYGRWQQSKNPLLSDATIAAAIKPIGDRVSALLALDPVNDYPTLVADSASAAPEVALMAWRKLGNAPLSEQVPALDDEDKAEAALAADFSTLSKAKLLDDGHLASLNAEVAAQRPVRWHRWVDTLTSAAAIQTALDRMDSFKVTLAPQADAAMLYNQAFYHLRKDFDKNLKEAELKPIAQGFIRSVNALPPAVGRDKTIQDLLTRMDKSLAQSQQESSAAGAGPKLAGWEQDNSKDGIRLFYYPSKADAKFTLEFDRLQVANKTVFMATTEVPVGLFSEVVNNANKFSDIDNAGKPNNKAHWFKASDDPWNGPRIWKIAGRKFTLNVDNTGKPLWLFRVPQMGDNPYYPEPATPSGPSADLPMQYLSPWSAMYAARLLGCRLPTSDEWLAAYDKFEAANTAAPKDAWNLRGAAWMLQQDYANKMAANGMKYPDDGIFLPVDLLFAPITSKDAKPWKGTDLAKLAADRITASADAYKGSILWFRKVGAQPGAAAPGTGSGAMHDLVGNVAEYAFDGTADKPANAVIKDANPSVPDIDAGIAGAKKALFVIGGSSLSPPDIVFNKKQPLDPDLAQTATGFSDVGFRLVYTAPIDSIVDVLAAAFKDPKYLPGRSGR